MDGGRIILLLVAALLVGCRSEKSPAEEAAEVLAWNNAATNQWGPITNSARLRIELTGGDRGLMTNEPFSLTYQIENLSSNQAIAFWDWPMAGNDPGNELYCIAISPRGKNITPKWDNTGGSAGTLREFKLSPGERQACEYHAYDYPFSETDSHTIIAVKEVGMAGQKAQFRLVSNPLCIRIVPGRWEFSWRTSPR